MKKPLKILAISLGVLLTLLLAAAVALPLLFDPNDFRTFLSAKVKEKTGRELTLGNIDLKVFPWLRARIDGVVLGNAPAFGAEPFAQVEHAELGVKLLPLLLDRRAEINTIELKGVQLQLAVDAQGQSNWADLVKDDSPDEAKTPEEDRGFNPKEVDIEGIRLEDVNAVYTDARSGQRLQLAQLRLKTGSIAPNQAFELDLATQLQAAQPEVAAEFALKGKVEHSPQQQHLKISGMQLKLDAAGPQLLGDKAARVESTLSADLSMDLSSQQLVLEKLRTQLTAAGPKLVGDKPAKLSSELTGQLAVNLQEKQLDVTGLHVKLNSQSEGLTTDLQLQTRLLANLADGLFQAPGLVLQGTVAGAAIPGGQQPVRLQTDLQLDRKDGTLLLNKLELASAGMQLTGRIEGTGIGSETPELSGPIRIASFNPRPLLQQLGVTLQTADPKALSQLSVDAQYQGTFSSARLENLNLQLDQSQVRGRFAVRDFKTKALEFALKIDQLDADRYLPPKAATGDETQGANAKQQTSQGEDKLPFEALQKLNANGSIDIGQFKLKGLSMTNVRLQLSGAPGAAQEQALSAQLYGGRINTNTRISPGTEPRVAAKVQLNSLQAAPFLRDLVGKDRVSGIGNLSLDVQGQGNTVDALKRSMDGQLAFRLENGAVKGFNLAQVLRRAQAALEGNVNVQESAPQETDFAVFEAAARIADGVLISDELRGASPLFRVTGEGRIDLVNNTIHYLAKPTVVKTSKGQGGKALEELAGITIPVKLTGNLFEPKVSLDLRAALEQQATAKIRERLADKEDELRGRLQDKISEKLGVDPATNGKPLSEDQLKQQLNQRLGDFLSGRKRKPEAPSPEPAAETPEPAPAAPTAPAPAEAAPEAPAPTPTP